MQTPEEFPFPFPPYKIQKEFMKELYSCLEKGNVGIFESPTGTGKSLSIICGVLKWLTDREEFEKNKLISEISDLDDKIKEAEDVSSNWFSIQTEQMKLKSEKQVLQAKLDKILKYENKKKQYKDIVDKEHEKQKVMHNKVKACSSKLKEECNDSDAKIKDLKDDDSDEEHILGDVISTSESSDEENEQEEEFSNIKIFFCSRTHSQLAQFVGELKRSPYAQSVSVLPIASRQNYCINSSVQKLRNVNLINERCLQLQRKNVTSKKERNIKKSKLTKNCPFMPGNQQLLMAKLLTSIQDIEEITQKSKEINTCAYYTVRKSVHDSQMILVPYNLVLHKSTRVSSGIDLKGNILIIDEAHNLLEAIEGMHSASITGRNITHCYNQLAQYMKRYQAFFSAQNMLRLNQLSFCLKKLLTVLGATPKTNLNDKINVEAAPKLYKVEQFEMDTHIDTLNIFDLINFIKKSKLLHKLQAFTDQYGCNLTVHEKSGQVTKKSGITEFLSSFNVVEHDQSSVSINTQHDEKETNCPLTLIISFLECLKNNCADGRVFVIPGSTIAQGIIKFLLLNPAICFYDIVADARAVILAGGTMEPVSEFTDQLFLAAGVVPERITTFSCDHVIPQENIISNIVTSGPTGIEFEFNFQNHQNTKLLDELGRALLNFCNIIPAGIVVFLPSYNFENTLYAHLETSKFIARMSFKKCIFREPKLTSQVNQILDQYAYHIRNPQGSQNGSLLFSVVGGKLSEGLNFSDDLGRCVIVVGMPYPNIKSIELQEKMKYLNENVKMGAGQNFYENSCMKAVNQCIGRSVRHINDYSTVILLDKRYSNKMKALPQWIQRTLTVSRSFGNTIGTIAKFFAAKRKNKK